VTLAAPGVWPVRGARRQDGPVTVIKINAITVPEGSGDELAQRFAARAGAVDGQEGFEGFELLKPTDDRNVWLVVTRWADQASFDAWVSSPGFAHGHRGADKPTESGAPVSVSAELWSYEVAGGSAG
jgi:heme oxygenase (mycobilin-producing)